MRRLPGVRSGVGAVPFGPGASRDPESDGRCAALVAWARRMPEARLASILWDGDLPEGPPPGWACGAGLAWGAGEACGAGEVRLLCYVATGVRLAVAVPRRPPRALTGRLWAAGVAGGWQVSFQGPLDDVGMGSVGADGVLAPAVVPHGPLRLVLRRPDRPVVATTWTLID